MRICIYLLGVVLNLTGCAGTKDQLLTDRIADITPTGCSYNTSTMLFSCTSREQEAYLKDNPITPYELNNIKSIVGLDTSLFIFTIMKLHECGMDMRESSIICTYEWKEDLVSLFSEEADIKEEYYNGKYIYVFYRKPAKAAPKSEDDFFENSMIKNPGNF